jgi:hypothetical protein
LTWEDPPAAIVAESGEAEESEESEESEAES